MTFDPYGRKLVHKYDNSKVNGENTKYKVLERNKELKPQVCREELRQIVEYE